VFTVENPVGEVTFTPPPTVRARSVSQKAPEFPHALTRKVCDRQQWKHWVLIDVAPLKILSVHHRQNKPCWLWVVHYSLRLRLQQQGRVYNGRAGRCCNRYVGCVGLVKAKATNRVTNIHDLAVENDLDFQLSLSAPFESITAAKGDTDLLPDLLLVWLLLPMREQGRVIKRSRK